MAAPKRDRGRPAKHTGPADRQGRTGVPLNIRLSPELDKAIKSIQVHYLQTQSLKVGKTQVIEMAIRKLCEHFSIEIPETPDADKA